MSSLAKSIFLVLLLFPVVACRNASKKKQTGKPVAEIIGGLDQNLGEINTPEVLSYTFEVKNTGTAALLLKRVKPTCGCTVANWTRKEITPGNKGTIDIQFDSEGYQGIERKNIIIETNANTKAIKLFFTIFVK